MQQTGDILRNLRKKRGLTQKELVAGIISRPNYSKIENNEIPPTTETLLLLLERLNLDYTDYIREVNKETTFNKYKAYFLRALSNDLTIKQVKELFDYVNQHRYISNRYFHFYGIVKGHLHYRFPEIIPNFSEEDKTYLKKYLSKLNKQYSLYDLKLIADFAGIFYTYKEFKKLVLDMPEPDLYAYADDIHPYKLHLHQIYNNICDIAIREKDFVTADLLLKKHHELLEVHPELRYNFFYEINRLSKRFYETNDPTYLNSIKKYADIFKEIQDYGTAEAIYHQIEAMKNNQKINPEDLITYS
ncbi:TPA: helix-turn-helix domain-containing protein [Enterococcus faecium]